MRQVLLLFPLAGNPAIMTVHYFYDGRFFIKRPSANSNQFVSRCIESNSEAFLQRLTISRRDVVKCPTTNTTSCILRAYNVNFDMHFVDAFKPPPLRLESSYLQSTLLLSCKIQLTQTSLRYTTYTLRFSFIHTRCCVSFLLAHFEASATPSFWHFTLQSTIILS